MKPKLLFLDVETTGVDHKKNGICQIAAILDVGEHTYFSVDYHVRPFPEDVVETSALELLGLNTEMLENFPYPKEVYLRFTKQLDTYIDRYNSADKAFIVAYNAHFDDSFLREWFRKNGDEYYGGYFHWPPIDVAVLVAYRNMKMRRDFPNFKLATVTQHLGIPTDFERVHDAEYDAELTRRLYYYTDK